MTMADALGSEHYDDITLARIAACGSADAPPGLTSEEAAWWRTASVEDRIEWAKQYDPENME